MASRKYFLKQLSATGTAMMLLPAWFNNPYRSQYIQDISDIPSYLADYADLYKRDPHQAALAWFTKAHFGLFMHYGLYSILGQGEWVQLREQIPVNEYEELKTKFSAKNFDADLITDLALEAGMKYVTLTAKHHEGFCLFKTNQTDYNSLSAPAQRDLVGDLKAACEVKGLGLFLYYSIAADWHYPYFLSGQAGWENYRPAYTHLQPEYLYKAESDFHKYITYAKKQIIELVTQYRPAGIWFDPIMGFYARPELFPMQEFYEQIRSLCPHTLISFKQGATGTEDFAAPERGAGSLYERVEKALGMSSALVAKKAWEANKNKHNETCNTLQTRTWGYNKNDKGKHKSASKVLNLLQEATSENMNLLLNTGPLPDGSIHPEDIRTLKQVGAAHG